MNTNLILKILLFLFALFLSNCDAILPRGEYLASGTPLWARSTTAGWVESNFSSISVYSDCIYTVGNFGHNKVNLNSSISMESYADHNLFIAKYDKNGVPIWAKCPVPGAGANESYFRSVAAAADGVYAVGYAWYGDYDLGDSVTFHNDEVWTYNTPYLLLAKYSTSGKTLWAKTVNGQNASIYVDVAIGSDGVYAVGSMQGIGLYDFGDGVQIQKTDFNTMALIAKYDFNGNIQWAKTTVNLLGSSFSSIAIQNNSIFVAGYIMGGGVTNFGNSITATGPFSNSNPVIVKYNSNGEAQWAVTNVYGSESGNFQDIAVDGTAIYSVGSIWGNGFFDFGGPAYVKGSTSTTSNCVLVKYDLDGIPKWARSTSAGEIGSIFNCVISSHGAVYAGGRVFGNSTYDFGNGIIIDTLADSNPILVKYNMNGTPQWSRTTISSDPYGADFSGVAAQDNTVNVVGNIGNGEFDYGGSKSIKGVSSHNLVIIRYKE